MPDKNLKYAFAVIVGAFVAMWVWQFYQSRTPINLAGTILPPETWFMAPLLVAFAVYFLMGLVEFRVPPAEKSHPYALLREPLELESFSQLRGMYGFINGAYRVHVFSAARDFRQKDSGERYKGAYIELYRPSFPEKHRWALGVPCLSFKKLVEYACKECSTEERIFYFGMFDANAFEIREQQPQELEFKMKWAEALANQGVPPSFGDFEAKKEEMGSKFRR